MFGSALSPGDRLWEQRYSGPGFSLDDPRAVGVSPDGSKVFVTGQAGGSDYDWGTVAYDAATGTQLWAKRYDGPAHSPEGANALGVSPDGSKLFVTGPSAGSGSDFDYATVAYDAATGTQLWVTRYNGPANFEDSAKALGVSPDGSSLFVTGSSFGSGSRSDYATVAYDAATGTQLWVRRFNGATNRDDGAYALGVSPDGSRVFVTGTSAGSGVGFTDYLTVAYNAATGHRSWVKRYKGPANGDDTPFALGVSPDGSKLFVTGTSAGSGSDFDYATVAYDAPTGTQLWVRRYNGPANADDGAKAVGVSPDGSRVFVTGYSYMSNYDFLTVAYNDATGTQLWVRRENGPANGYDSGSALGVSPDGSRVFVTGASEGLTSSYDYLTVAYSTG